MARRRFSPEKLEAEMSRLEVSKRELGKRLAELRGIKPESGRIHVIGLLPQRDRNGRVIRVPLYATPTQKTIESLASALGVSVEAITDPDPLAERVTRLRRRQDARRAA